MPSDELGASLTRAEIMGSLSHAINQTEFGESRSGHPQTTKDLLRTIIQLSPETFINRHVLDRTPWIFESRTKYAEWKFQLAYDLDVDPLPMSIVGSAGLGFSLSPGKKFSEFHQDSDIDVAIISNRHFEEAWLQLRSLGPLDRLKPGSSEAEVLDWHRGRLIFDGAIATDKILGMLPFGAKWTRAFSRASNREPTTGREINGRIYRDCQSLREYQVNNLRRIRTNLISAGESFND
ncbi:hypothetical protein [Amycolatopsis sp. lyj-90]|uniref:hypothetical protein n=1 Tax=Amycolatopsis sp. lyj-90 TaxID=2789285 RepID=UPI00397CBF65